MQTADPAMRLGCYADAKHDGTVADVVAHEFFKSIDWKKLMNYELDPPHIPDVEDDEDISNFEEPDDEEEVVGDGITIKDGDFAKLQQSAKVLIEGAVSFDLLSKSDLTVVVRYLFSATGTTGVTKAVKERDTMLYNINLFSHAQLAELLERPPRTTKTEIVGLPKLKVPAEGAMVVPSPPPSAPSSATSSRRHPCPHPSGLLRLSSSRTLKRRSCGSSTSSITLRVARAAGLWAQLTRST